MDLPRVMVGGPVRDRAWIAHEWLSGLCNQDYPNYRVVVLVNDSKDETKDICEWYAYRYPGLVEVREQNFGCTHDNNNRNPGRDYRQFANVRNAWVALRTEADDYLWSCDSDVICPPDTLSRLVARQEKVVAAMIENLPQDNAYHVNALVEYEDSNTGATFLYWPPELINSQEMVEVDLTGACYLIHREVFDQGVRYDDHERGEDNPFCEQARAKGYKLYIDGSIRCDHRMRRHRFEPRMARAYAADMSDYWAWRVNRWEKFECA